MHVVTQIGVSGNIHYSNIYMCEFLLDVKRDTSVVRWLTSLCSVSSAFCKYVGLKTAIGFPSAEGIQTVVMYGHTAQTNIANSFHNYTKSCAFSTSSMYQTTFCGHARNEVRAVNDYNTMLCITVIHFYIVDL